ncbi:MAG TPA: hypothetical protein VHM47_01580 [Actinomycetota bacterium]|nr:hypothetical protein [Actinomycetota bacterium]
MKTTNELDQAVATMRREEQLFREGQTSFDEFRMAVIEAVTWWTTSVAAEGESAP